MIQPITIFYYNDIHGNTDRMAGIVDAAKQYKCRPDAFILSAGDNYSGAEIKENEFVLDIMQSLIGVELSAVGNHELDATSNGLLQANSQNKITFVATNAIFTQDSAMNNVVKTSMIKQKDGVKYGFVGAMPLDFDYVSKACNRKDIKVMDFEQSVEAIQKEIDKLKEQDINKIILLSHSGYDIDKKYAKNLDGVDIIIGGHSHTVIQDAEQDRNVILSKSGEPVLIVQAGENANYYGVIQAEFNDKGILTKIQNNLMTSLNTNKSMLIEYLKDLKLGKSPYVTNISYIDPMPDNRRTSPCAWTYTIADCMREYFNTDISIVNATNIRKIPQQGSLTERDITESAPMKNDLMVTTITQKQIVDAIKNSCKKTMLQKTGKPGLLMFSGIKYKIDKLGNLLELIIGEDKIDINNPTNKQYTACYDIFVGKKDGEYPELYPQFGVQMYDFDKDKITADLLRQKENIIIKDDGRLQILKSLDIQI